MKKAFLRISCMALIVPVIFISCNLDSLNPSKSLVDRLHEFKNVSIDFGADIKSNNEFLSFSSCGIDNVQPLGESQNYPIEWDGLSFSVNYDHEYELFSGERVRTYGTISGTLSEDGEMIESMTGQETSTYPDLGDVYKDFLTIINVPYDPTYLYDEYTPRFSVEGPEVRNHIYSYSQSWDFYDSDGNPQQMYATTVDYFSETDVPYLYVTFSED